MCGLGGDIAHAGCGSGCHSNQQHPAAAAVVILQCASLRGGSSVDGSVAHVRLSISRINSAAVMSVVTLATTATYRA